MVLGLLALLVVLLASSAFFSGSETALFSLDRLARKEFEQHHDNPSRRVLRLIGNPNRLLATLLLGNTLVNIAASSVATAFYLHLFPHSRPWVPFAVMTTLILLLGEIVPKCMALSFPRVLARAAGGGLAFFERLVSPVVAFATHITDAIVPGPAAPAGGAGSREEITAEEIRSLVQEAEMQGHLTSEEVRLTRRIFDFAGIRVQEVMTPWIDVVKIASSFSRAQAESVLRESRHSRVPVTREDEDDVIGYLTAKTYLANQEEDVETHLRPVLIIPEHLPTHEALRRMRAQHRQLVVVVDEHGRPVGIITMEDVVEEIVGEIYDEFEAEESPIVPVAPHRYRVSGQAPLDLVEEKLGLKLGRDEEEEFVTLNGYLCHLLGEIPEPGVRIHQDGVTFHVIDVEKNRIRECEVRLPEGRAVGS